MTWVWLLRSEHRGAGRVVFVVPVVRPAVGLRHRNVIPAVPRATAMSHRGAAVVHRGAGSRGVRCVRFR
jgi:hypothetical protein